MNKDVIYIEPEDDITDIILKIEKSKEKIVALVPPKKAGVFRSIVNIKLMAKAGKTAKKQIVLVTTDPSIKKIAATVKLPVTKNLQSAPSIPVLEEEDDDELSSEELFESSGEENSTEDEDKDEASEDTGEALEEAKSNDKPQSEDEALEPGEKTKDDALVDEDDVDDSTEKDRDEKKDERKKKENSSSRSSVKSKNPREVNKSKAKSGSLIDWVRANKKLSIALGAGGILLVLFLVWALIIAPSVTVEVSVRTTSNNFSENVTFSTKLEEEDMESGKFYLETKKIESSHEVTFEATGKKNTGERASGEVDVYAYFPLNISASTQVKEGETFTISGLTYVATKEVTLEYSGRGKEECANKATPEGLVDYGCRINGKVSVVASAPGTKYNIAASSTGWDTNARVFAYSSKDMTGGTDQEITVVTQADIDKAKEQLLASASNEADKKELLYNDQINDDDLVIDSSFKETAADAVASPAVGEEVKEGTTPTLKATTVTSVFVLDKTKVEEFITKKAALNDSQRIYDMKKPFVESFLETSSGYSGKLKTSYAVGPRITENGVIEIIKGKGLGEAQHDLKDIEGIEVEIDKSVPWVTSIPNDPNKITVIFDIKDQSGNKIEVKQESEDEQVDSSSSEGEEANLNDSTQE